MAERDDDAYRRSGALYQLSNLYLALKQPQNALDASRQAYRFAEAAGSTPGMVKARMAESAALEILDDPARELAAMEEALALARKSQSQVGESLALINLADIRLRRKQFDDALDLSRRSLALAPSYDDVGLDRDQQGEHRDSRCSASAARPKASGYADEALADYERTGATAEIASLLGEYGQYLEKAGRLQDRAGVLPPRAQAPRGDGRGRAPAVGARAAGEIRVGKEPARDRAAQSPERAQLGGARKPGAAGARLVAVRRGLRDLARRDRRALPEAARQQRPARAEEPGTERAQQPRSADRALQPALFPGLHARRARRGRSAGAAARPTRRSTRCSSSTSISSSRPTTGTATRPATRSSSPWPAACATRCGKPT